MTASPAPSSPPLPAPPGRSRGVVIAILAVFLVPFALAGLLRFTNHYPAATRQKGELLQPPADLRGVTPHGVDSSVYAWNPVARTWRVLVPVPSNCDATCVRVARDVDTVWQLLGQDQDRTDVLWWCSASTCAWPEGVHRPTGLHLLAPDAGARARLPRVDATPGVPVYVVDPNGFVILRYAPGADLSGLRADLSRLLKLQ